LAHSDLRSFIDALDAAGQLRRVSARVDPELEITEIADRMSKAPCPEGAAGAPPTDPIHGGFGGSGLLFENVLGSDIPVAINLYGSYERMRIALGCDDFEALADRVRKLVKPTPPSGMLGKMKMLPELAKIAASAPKSVRRGVCQEVVHTDDADLFSLPIIKCWPFDGGADEDVIVGLTRGSDENETASDPAATPVGRYITLAGIHTTAPDGSDHNVGMYRIQVTGPKSALFHCHIHHDGARHHRMWAAEGKDMPVAIALGGESVLPYAATCPLPPGVSELLFAGFLNGGGIAMVPRPRRCRSTCRPIPRS